MIVGQTGSGKSVTWKMLRNTLSRLKKENRGPQYQIVRVCMYVFTFRVQTAYIYMYILHIYMYVYSTGILMKWILYLVDLATGGK